MTSPTDTKAQISKLLDLQEIISQHDFETVESFLQIYHSGPPEKMGQVQCCFWIFIENMEKRYETCLNDYHSVIMVNYEDVEQRIIDNKQNLAAELRGMGKHR